MCALSGFSETCPGEPLPLAHPLPPPLPVRTGIPDWNCDQHASSAPCTPIANIPSLSSGQRTGPHNNIVHETSIVDVQSMVGYCGPSREAGVGKQRRTAKMNRRTKMIPRRATTRHIFCCVNSRTQLADARRTPIIIRRRTEDTVAAMAK